MPMKLDSKIFLAGHSGLVGSAIGRGLKRGGYRHVVGHDEHTLDLTSPVATLKFFERDRPEYVFLAAAKVGGILANNTYPADFIRVNLQIEVNVVDACFRTGVKKLLFLGSSCIYPKLAQQPLREDSFLTGVLEPTNDAYAVAKIAGIMLCKSYNRQHGTNYIAAMPTNLYGPGDNFDLETSHVLPAMIRKFHEAKRDGKNSVELWGTGTPRRELLYVDDLADALVYLMNNYDVTDATRAQFPFVNVGVGTDQTIAELAELVRRVVGYQGEIAWNRDMPDGTPQKLLDVSKLHAMGWRAQTSLEQGVRQTYQWYLENRAS